MSIKDNVDRIRREKKMTWAKLSEETGLSRDTFMRWDKHSPSIASLQKTADALKCRLSDLLKTG